MRLEEVLPAYRAGKELQLKTTSGVYTFKSTGYDVLTTFSEAQLLSEQWSIVEEPITITREQFERAAEKVFPDFPVYTSSLWEELKK